MSHYDEGGIRVPAAMRWPGTISPGSTTDEMLHAVYLPDSVPARRSGSPDYLQRVDDLIVELQAAVTSIRESLRKTIRDLRSREQPEIPGQKK